MEPRLLVRTSGERPGSSVQCRGRIVGGGGGVGYESIGWGVRGGGGVPVAFLNISLLVSLDFARSERVSSAIAPVVRGLKN